MHSINGTSVTTYAVEQDGVEFGSNDMAGGDVQVPYQAGEYAGSRSLKGRDYPLYLTVIGTGANTAAQIADAYTKSQALSALLLNADANGDPQKYTTFTRVLALTAGTQTCTIAARLSEPLRWSRPSPWVFRVVPVIRLLDGWWLSGATKVYF